MTEIPAGFPPVQSTESLLNEFCYPIVDRGADQCRGAVCRIPRDRTRQGKFTFDRLTKFYRFDEINQAMSDSESGETIKPILRINP